VDRGARRLFEFLAQTRHLTIDLLNLRHQGFFALRKLNELFERFRRDARDHVTILTRQIDNATPTRIGVPAS
jgi:hypothetical protein